MESIQKFIKFISGPIIFFVYSSPPFFIEIFFGIMFCLSQYILIRHTNDKIENTYNEENRRSLSISEAELCDNIGSVSSETVDTKNSPVPKELDRMPSSVNFSKPSMMSLTKKKSSCGLCNSWSSRIKNLLAVTVSGYIRQHKATFRRSQDKSLAQSPSAFYEEAMKNGYKAVTESQDKSLTQTPTEVYIGAMKNGHKAVKESQDRSLTQPPSAFHEEAINNDHKSVKESQDKSLIQTPSAFHEDAINNGHKAVKESQDKSSLVQTPSAFHEETMGNGDISVKESQDKPLLLTPSAFRAEIKRKYDAIIESENKALTQTPTKRYKAQKNRISQIDNESSKDIFFSTYSIPPGTMVERGNGSFSIVNSSKQELENDDGMGGLTRMRMAMYQKYLKKKTDFSCDPAHSIPVFEHFHVSKRSKK